MRRMRARVVALLTAAVLGAGGGVTTALVAGDGASGDVAADPLGIGIAMVDLECTGEAVLVVGYGDGAPALRAAVLNSPSDEEVRYLDTSRSCDARWTPARSSAEPAWVAYIGPGDRTDLCLARLSEPAHQGDNVTFLRAGNNERAMCLCEVRASAAPELRPRTSDPDGRNRVWVAELQDMLITIDAQRGDAAPTDLTEADRTGVYDERTAARIDVIRKNARMVPNGVVDERVWGRVTTAGCGFYDYA